MTSSTIPFSQIIMDTLAAGERRELSLIVAIRNVSRTFKGDLASLTRSSLRKLVASGALVESDGMYSLSKPGSRRERTASGNPTGSTAKNSSAGETCNL
jgi:hypothetical protein